MNLFCKLISKYVIQAILPYFLFTWILLSVILFVQQASRYSDIFFNANLPTGLIWQLTFALVPSVIAFTCPMAILVGVIIGLAKMQGDSELTAIRAAGVGNFQVVLPIVFLGLILSAFAFLINWQGVPLAAQVVRKVALQTALFKMESPIEPGVFNTEIRGYTVYVKSGDILRGTWENIFIFNEDKQSGQMRLITSKNGKIDSNNEDSELVLDEALVSTFTPSDANKPVLFDKIKNLRFVIQTKRGEIIERLSKTEENADELGLSELAAFARKKEGKERTEAEILWQRRIILSVTPLLFALLGASLILRFNRGGRGFGIFLALVSLIGYYLLALMGEQLARTNRIGVLAGGALPIVVTVALIIWLNISPRIGSMRRIMIFSRLKESFLLRFESHSNKRSFPNLATGILDFDIVSNLLKFFALSIGFLGSIYVIFTAFEMWRFAGTIDNGFSLLTNYLGYLLPHIYIQIAPSCLMIATLATFVIKSRQNEVVTWTAAGQSVYRLLLPCFLTMAAIGLINWQIQERVLPKTNRAQDALRTQIRNKGILAAKEGKFWIASDNRVYSFDLNEKDFARQRVTNLYVFEFAGAGDSEKLKSFTKSEEAIWSKDKIELTGNAQKNIWQENNRIENKPLAVTERTLEASFNPFRQLYTKPTQLTASETAEKLESSESESEKRIYAVALEKKYTTIVLPFIITLFTAPFALSLSRKGKAMTVGYAVGVWLLFMGITNTFEQFGLNGYVAPPIAVWSPLVLFTIIGIYLITKVKT
ncbi:MAG TPA: LptF/LptG family permease [Pyrinomonadaceae bacterium]|jgi:lipopolysaccharide export LptBFGC system permease protein LptF